MKSQKPRSQPVADNLNLFHFRLYVGVGTAVLAVGFLVIASYLEGWLLYLSVFALFFLYGVCRYPIVKGTDEGDPEAGIVSLRWLVFKWAIIGLFVVGIIGAPAAIRWAVS